MKPIYLRLSKPFGELAVEASRFWGSPALPKGMDYPQYIDDAGDEYPYVFVCQINLAELKAFCGDGADPLPPTGLLLFFAKIDHYLGRHRLHWRCDQRPRCGESDLRERLLRAAGGGACG